MKKIYPIAIVSILALGLGVGTTLVGNKHKLILTNNCKTNLISTS